MPKLRREILDYVLRDMTDTVRWFLFCRRCGQSVDAQLVEHLKEGAFYVFSQTEIEEALGKDVAAVFNYCYGVLPQGNAAFDPHGEFRGKNILYRAHSIEEAAGEFHRQTNEIQGILKVGISNY